MNGGLAAGAAGCAVLVALPLLLTASMGGTGAAQAQLDAQTQTGPSSTLNMAAVPPQLVGFVEQAATMCPQVSGPLLAAQIEVESGWDPAAQSAAGAQGISQFLAGTWLTWGRDYDHDGAVDVFDPGDAIPAQAAMMCALVSSVQQAAAAGRVTHGTTEQDALAAYNCGLGNVLRSGGFPTGIGQTDAYVPRIQALEAKYTATPTAGGPGGPGLPPTVQAAAAVAAAKRYLAYPYVWGGGDTRGPTGRLWSTTPPLGFDCEGLVRYAIFAGYGIDIGAGTRGQLVTPALTTVAVRTADQPEPLSLLAPGDVVVMNYHPSSDGPWGHVALYVGAGMFIHAPHTGDVVKIVPAAEFAATDWTVRRVQ